MVRMPAIAVLVVMFASPCGAMIYIDEGFEDSTPLTDLNYPIADSTTPPSQALLDTYQGVNYRSGYGVPSDIVVMSNTGTVSTALAYNGVQSLQLASGRSVGNVSSTPSYSYANQNWYNVLQFAIGVSTETLALPPGVQVGHLATNWSTDGDNGTTELVYQVNFVRNTTDGVDVAVQQGNVFAGRLVDVSNDRGKWAVVSLIVDKQALGPINWENWDPLTLTYKGPQPTGADTFPPSGAYARLTDGMNLLVNSNNVSNLLSAAALGHGWITNPNADATYLRSWIIAAENGGTLFIDELFWSHGYHDDGSAAEMMNQDGAARMIDFMPELASPPRTNSARDWNIYY